VILMYHKVYPETPSIWWVSVDSFYRQLHEVRYKKVVYLDEYDPDNADHVVITFDGVYRNVLEYAAPILQKFGYPFELFVTSNYVGGDNQFDVSEPRADFASKDELVAMTKMGGRLQWHTRSHINLQEIKDLSAIERELDIPNEIRALDRTGFTWFAYPHGDYNSEVLKAVRTKFSGAVSCVQGDGKDKHLYNRVTATDDLSLKKAQTSVIIASYNYGQYLIEAVESVLHQTVPADEILISDDCSNDETWDIARHYKEKYPEVIQINRNEQNLGIVAHFNKAISLTSGEYVCILGADNRYRSDFLERTSSVLDASDGFAVAYTDFALFGARAEIIASEMCKHWGVEEVAEQFYIVHFPDYDCDSQKTFSEINFMHGSSLFRRKSFDDVRGYQEKEAIPEDYDLFTRMMSQGWSAARVPYPLLEYRQHSREQANVNVASEALLQFYRQNHEQAQADIEVLQDYIRRMRSSLAWKFATPVRVAENLYRRYVSKYF